MIQINKEINILLTYDLMSKYDINKVVFFDIETTGFNSRSTVLYLIGCVYYENNKWNLIQWFSDKINGEVEILYSFFNFIKNYNVIIHYNGNGFDIPYIEKKCTQHKLSFSFEQIESLDLYKMIRPYKNIFKIDNLKQKTIEQYLNIIREDPFSGGELIEVYFKYLQFKEGAVNRSKELLHTLALHNQDDLKGIFSILDILSYCDLFEGNFEVEKCELSEEALDIKLIPHLPLPKRISCGNDLVYLNILKNTVIIKVKLYKNELKFFYDNYKDYFYLPMEDQAIHKSVAFYVDKNFRAKAKAANCYSKKTGAFVPQYEEIVNPYFKIDFFDKITYFEPLPEVMENKKTIKHYCVHIFRFLLNSNKKH